VRAYEPGGKPPACRWLPLFLCALSLCTLGAAAAGCRQSQTANLEIKLVVPEEPGGTAALMVVGVPPQYLPGRAEVSADEWPSILRVTVAPEGDDPSRLADPDLPAVAGSYSVSGEGIVFKPLFGFDPGLRYRAVFDASKMPGGGNSWKPEPIVAIVGVPKKHATPTTVVDRITPSMDTVPENQLRLYLHFSAPMGRKGGIEYVHLLDARGREVEQPFLPIDGEFWNGDRTRFTVFFDPGRVKRGILPNRKLGRPLQAGKEYTLVVDREWRDGEGLPLKDTFRRTFRAGPADMRPLDPVSWRIKEPAAGSRDPLVVTFPEPLDHGLLLRALGVAAGGSALFGEIAISAHETQWAFTPREPWTAGGHQLVALTILEDLAGNRIGRAFEIDEFEQVDREAEQDRITLPFQVR
jgi:hypothetical protein